ncbi:MAG: hypothetical protein WCI43_08410, partial [Candidatus Firestonebacteria bacterium]
LTPGWNALHDCYNIKGFQTGVPYLTAVRLTTPVVVPENPTGKWIGKMEFELSHAFSWDDTTNNNGKFEPGNIPLEFNSFACEAPVITVTFDKQ